MPHHMVAPTSQQELRYRVESVPGWTMSCHIMAAQSFYSCHRVGLGRGELCNLQLNATSTRASSQPHRGDCAVWHRAPYPLPFCVPVAPTLLSHCPRAHEQLLVIACCTADWARWSQCWCGSARGQREVFRCSIQADYGRRQWVCPPAFQ
jgi:hypothetical protein